LVNGENIEELLRKCKNRECDISGWIWQMVSFVLWWEMFIDGNGLKGGVVEG
jgi:hypothetical protein